MRILLTIIAFVCFCSASFSQTFNGGGGAIPGSSTAQTCFNVNVTGVGVINSITRGLASVCLNINHPDVGDLEIVVVAPDGTMVPLSIQNGDAGNNYTNTCFTATAANSIKFANPPYNGSFLPEGWLGAVNNGQNANGQWRLCIRDRRNPGSSGNLLNWSITFNTTPAPQPPPRPACANTLPSTSSCSSATLVCDFNGQCGSTSGSSVQDWTGSGLGSCFGLQNNSFIKFIASATTATFSVWVPSTSQTNQQGGIQMMFFSGTCNSGPVTTHGCYPRILPYPAGGQPLVTLVTANNLIPGNTYYLMIDGANNDNCSFVIAANTGVNVLNINPAAPAICAGGSVNLTASGGNGIYSWSPATNLNTTSGATVSANPPGTVTYTVTSTTATGCPLTKDVTVTVNPLPASPTAGVMVQPTCTVSTGTITVTAPLGAGFTYSVNGTTYQSGTSFTGLPPGPYNVTVRNTTTGCTSTATVLTVNAAPTPPAAPTASVTSQPTCIVLSGTITITAPTGAGLQYSIGGAYQASPVFSGLTPGPYNVTVQNAGGCTSAATTLTVNVLPPTPVAPTASATAQPTCGTPTGTITITAPTGAGLLYSIGGPYQASPVFMGLTQNVYNVTVQNAPGCTSPGSSVTINAAPTAPAVPTATVTAQPTCTVTTGTITITAPTGAGLEYSVNGTTYQTGLIFTGLTPAIYNVTVRNTTTGCTSAATTLTVNAAPTAPVAPTASVTTHPTCTAATGTITITAPTGAGLEYSINGITYQPGLTFPGLTSGIYNVTVRNTTTGCTSTATALTVNGVPTAPVAPTASVTTQPTCAVATGTITIAAPTGAGLEYSVNGTIYQPGLIFAGLAPGIHNVTVRNTTTGCVSTATALTVNATPIAPVAPTASVTTPPTCTVPTGTITVTAPTGAGLEYSVDGTTYQASTIFSNLNPNTYSITVRNITTGCTSSATLVTIGAAPATQPGPPNIGTVHPTCTTLTGSIIITPPAGSNLEYSINGTTYQASPVFNNVPPGPYSITVRNTVTGCISAAITTTVNAPPTLPTAPTGSVTTHPSCTSAGGEITITAPLGANYEYSLSGGTYQASPVFSNLAPGNYFVTVRNIISGCVSPQLSLTVNNNPVRPDQPVVDVKRPDCTVATGTITITSPLGAGLQYSTDGNVYQTSPVFSALPEGTYLIRVKNPAGCVSPITAVIILDAATEPAKPVITVVQPKCPKLTGTITVNSPSGSNIEYSINGTSYQLSNVFDNLPGGNYTVTARFTGTTCVSAITNAVITAIPPQQCETPTGTDIYFPSAFTPNGDQVNDGFGPGPRSNLGTVTGYSLMVFNRYGEMVFTSNNPLQQWNGSYKGKMLANNAYTWVAKYRFAGSAERTKKGTVLIIR